MAKALLHNPKLLLLDEPANGLDPAGIVEIRALLIEQAHQQGVTVFMSSHILAEVSRLANRIGIIHEGHLLQELEVKDLEKNRRRRLLVRVRDPGTARAALTAAGFLVEPVEDGSLGLRDQAALDHPDEIASLLVQAKTPPTHLSLDLEDLEQYFLRLVGLQGGLK